MTDLQDAKALVRAHQRALAEARPETVAEILRRTVAPDWHWRGMHPWHEQTGPDAVAEAFWQPFLSAMTRVQRREDIFFAGQNGIPGTDGTWVVSMGHLMALFDAPFLGIRPNGRIAMLRYAEFHRVAGGRIVETAFFCDLLHLMAQVGIHPLSTQTGAHLVQPGPASHDGLLTTAQDAAEGRKTLSLIDRMIGAIGEAGLAPSPGDDLARDWHDDMVWWGPEGIGATYTIARYIRQHQAPFRRGLTNRTFNGHVARLAESHYGGFFGWPNLTLTPAGGYLGLTANGEGTADMRVVDIYRRDGDKLRENWIFIDLLHFLNMQGLDVLDRLTEIG